MNEEQFKKILGYIDLGKKEGAKLLTGGTPFYPISLFLSLSRPTLFYSYIFLISLLISFLQNKRREDRNGRILHPAHGVRRRDRYHDYRARGDLRSRAIHPEVQDPR